MQIPAKACQMQARSPANNASVIGLLLKSRLINRRRRKASTALKEALLATAEDLMNRTALMVAFLSLSACQEQSQPLSPAGLGPMLQTGAPTTKTNAWVFLNYSFFSNCTREFLLVTGKLHVESTVWNDSDRLRIHSHINANLAARGLTSGLAYRVQELANQKHEMTWETGAAQADQVFHFRLISASGAPNSYLTMNGTWLFGADGTVTIEPRKWESVCR